MNADTTTRVGIFICECGGEIARILDTEAIRQRAAELPGVVYAATDSYPCSKDSRLRIQQAIKKHNINRVFVAGCTPRLMNDLFEKTIQSFDFEHCETVFIGEENYRSFSDNTTLGVEWYKRHRSYIKKL